MGLCQSSPAEEIDSDSQSGVEEISGAESRRIIEEEEEPPPPRGSELALLALREMKRSNEFASLLSTAKRQALKQLSSPGNGQSFSDAQGEALTKIKHVERGDSFEPLLQSALSELAHVVIPAMALSKTPWGKAGCETQSRVGYHMFQGTWWPSALHEELVERLQVFWSSLAPSNGAGQEGAEDEASSFDLALERVLKNAASRAAAYEAAEARWTADDTNEVRTRAREREQFHFFVHASNMCGRADAEQLEAARKAAVDKALVCASVYEAVDAKSAPAGKDGIVDWSQTSQALLRTVDMEPELRRHTTRRATTGAQARLRRTSSIASPSAHTPSVQRLKNGEMQSIVEGEPRKKKKKKNRMSRRSSSLRLPAWALYGGGGGDENKGGGGKFVEMEHA